MDGQLNYIPKMSAQKLLGGYKHLLENIYAPRAYYRRIKILLREYQLPARRAVSISLRNLLALFRSFWVLGIKEKGRLYYWNLLLHCLLRYPQKITLAVTLAIYGFHFRRVAAAV
jgi:hypothetical protein